MDGGELQCYKTAKSLYIFTYKDLIQLVAKCWLGWYITNIIVRVVIILV